MAEPAKHKDRKPRPGGGKRRAARLAAVQALYQIEIAGIDPDAVVLEFLQHRVNEEIDGHALGELDQALFAELVREVHARRGELDDMLSAVVDEAWSVERLDTLLRVLLRAGLYELAYKFEVPARAAIAEYVGIAHDFFFGKEPAMANGMLDRLARSLREEEFAE
ncbi:NusB antitermination factor [Tistlia consotensis]|uniref:Transcription antitermination protein NusB n=1 Tax=Tistlia consotensis USBA 355 TaxID=560819 RepID=A0A1Y6BP32_9PROT|nr:transcription antitermination factor NusB [Tistlia consotensis]SMF20917.1 NusB antitermination factor [Tistlia consotensis USBA 355]SNR47386.1 NusB antitermination factor [Tistlia consotensis]